MLFFNSKHLLISISLSELSFFQAAVVSIRLYGCTTSTLTKRMEKKHDGNYTRMLRAILNKSWRQHPTNQQLYGHLTPITKTIKVRRARHAGNCLESKNKLISDVLQWTPSHGRAKAGRPARTYIQQPFEDMGCSPEDLPEWTIERGCKTGSCWLCNLMMIKMMILNHQDQKDISHRTITIYSKK